MLGTVQPKIILCKVISTASTPHYRWSPQQQNGDQRDAAAPSPVTAHLVQMATCRLCCHLCQGIPSSQELPYENIVKLLHLLLRDYFVFVLLGFFLNYIPAWHWNKMNVTTVCLSQDETSLGIYSYNTVTNKRRSPTQCASGTELTTKKWGNRTVGESPRRWRVLFIYVITVPECLCSVIYS